MVAAQLRFRQQDPASRVIGNQPHGEGCQPGCILGLAHSQQAGSCLGDPQSSRFHLLGGGQVDVGNQGPGRVAKPNHSQPQGCAQQCRSRQLERTPEGPWLSLGW